MQRWKGIMLVGCLVGTALAALPVASAGDGTSCSVSSKSQDCSFACSIGDSIFVTATNSAWVGSAQVDASCADAMATCTAAKGSSCKSTSTDKATVPATGMCHFSGWSGTGSCGASGGSTQGHCINVVLTCIKCPDTVCESIGKPRIPIAHDPLDCLNLKSRVELTVPPPWSLYQSMSGTPQLPGGGRPLDCVLTA